MAGPLHIGIDLGTTNSTAAVFNGTELTVVRNTQGSVLTPSVVRIDARGNALVGARARRFLDTDPANTRAEFKRLMGTAHQLEFPASKTTRSPEQLAAEVLRSWRKDVADQVGVMPSGRWFRCPRCSNSRRHRPRRKPRGSLDSSASS